MSTPPSSPPQSILRPSSIKISQSDYYKLTYIFLFKVFCSLHANKYVEACHVCNNLYAVISKVRLRSNLLTGQEKNLPFPYLLTSLVFLKCSFAYKPALIANLQEAMLLTELE